MGFVKLEHYKAHLLVITSNCPYHWLKQIPQNSTTPPFLFFSRTFLGVVPITQALPVVPAPDIAAVVDGDDVVFDWAVYRLAFCQARHAQIVLWISGSACGSVILPFLCPVDGVLAPAVVAGEAAWREPSLGGWWQVRHRLSV